jgi:hypothetical protein
LAFFFAAQAGAILSGIKSLESIGYALAVFVVIIRTINIAGAIVLSAYDKRKAWDKVHWHWVMLFPTFAMAASGWIATAIIYGVAEFVFMVLAYHYKEIEGRK